MLSWKKQKRMMLIGYIAMIPLAITLIIVLMSNVSAKKGSFTDDSTSVEEITTEDAETPKTTQISPYEGGGMPCDNPDAFKEWYETYEQETEEEEVEVYLSWSDGSESTEVEKNILSDTNSQTAESETVLEEESAKIYSVNGQTLNPDLQAYLYQRLSEHNIEQFMPYAILICYQESHFNPYAENPNGKDKGLFQYRKAYYPGQDIFNPYEQIDIFAQQMAHRAEIGCDVYEMISRHNVSDYMPYNHEYVATVLSHEPKLREVKQ